MQQQQQKSDSSTAVIDEDIAIVGAGLAGLATALGLHRLGIRSLVLESSDSLRTTGFAIGLWTNAWKALDALGVGDKLRQETLQIQGDKGELRSVRRKHLLETLEKELPQGTIRYSSKVVSIEESGSFKQLQLADGSVVKTKVLVGCDGINSRVAKWLGFGPPVSVGRSEIRGFVEFEEGHGIDPKFHLYLTGVRFGFLPVDAKNLYWFYTFPSALYKYDENEHDSSVMKQFVWSNVQNAPKLVKQMVERTTLDFISCFPLKCRLPWDVLLGNIAKNNVCVAGDALHPMTPDIGQGGCSALEDSVVLARSIDRALSENSDEKNIDGKDCYAKRIDKGLEDYARERRLRSFNLVCVSFIVGFVQESDGAVMNFLRKKFLSGLTVRLGKNMSEFDCGKLNVS